MQKTNKKASPVQGEVDCVARRWGCLKASISATFSAMKKDDLHIWARIRVSLYGGYNPSFPLALSYNPSVTASRATFPYTGTAKLGLSKPLRSNFATIIKRSEAASLLVSERVQIAPRAQIFDLQGGIAPKAAGFQLAKEYKFTQSVLRAMPKRPYSHTANLTSRRFNAVLRNLSKQKFI